MQSQRYALFLVTEMRYRERQILQFNSHVFIENGNVNLKESFNFAGNLNLLFTHSTYLKPANKKHYEEEE